MKFKITFSMVFIFVASLSFILVTGNVLAGKQKSGSESVQELMIKLKQAYSTQNVEIIYELCDFTGADEQEIRKLYKGFITDYKPYTISSMTITGVDPVEERMYADAGYKFNIPVVGKIRIYYEELLEKMKPAPIVYYYVGVKDERYFFNALVPDSEKDSSQADNSGDDDMIVIVPVNEE